jgi:hypothetical protein
MSYIGNQVTSVPHIVDLFNGNGSSTIFGVLTRAPAGTAAVVVFVNGSYKIPGIDYTLSGDIITFTTAPSVGTNNIAVHHIGNGTTTQVPSDGSVTGNKLAATSVSGNNLTQNSIRGNNIVAGTITGNLIADSAVAGNNIVANTITGNLVTEGAISANHFSSSANTKILSTGFVGSIIFGA